jgi:hypothetical protein
MSVDSPGVRVCGCAPVFPIITGPKGGRDGRSRESALLRLPIDPRQRGDPDGPRRSPFEDRRRDDLGRGGHCPRQFSPHGAAGQAPHPVRSALPGHGRHQGGEGGRARHEVRGNGADGLLVPDSATDLQRGSAVIRQSSRDTNIRHLERQPTAYAENSVVHEWTSRRKKAQATLQEYFPGLTLPPK